MTYPSEKGEWTDEQYMDSWDLFFNHAKALYKEGKEIAELCRKMCDVMMTRDEKMRELVRKYFRPEDYLKQGRLLVAMGN